LANDPHLNGNLPSHWYLAHLKVPGWEAAGATFVGGPGVLAGHNGHIAWGVTAGLADNTDLFRERVGPDGQSVLENGRWVPCPVREEVIAVRGAAPVVERVLVTPRGPVISPSWPEFPSPDGTQEVLSIRATWLDPLPVRGLLCLHKARDFAAFRAALAQWPATTQNVVYADAAGAVGWQLAGRVPRRRKGHGTLPQAGWDPEAGWEADPVPPEEMPHLLNPAEGFVATANNQPLPAGAGPFLGVDWIEGYRLAAIRRRLAARADWDVASTLALQTDQQSLPWEELRDVVLAAPAADADARQALELLRGWDGRVAADSPAAAVFELFAAEMSQRVARAKAPNSHAAELGRGDGPLTTYNFFAFRRTGHLADLLRTQPAGWFARPWPAEAADALAAAVRSLRSAHGPDAAAWAWGRVRPLTLLHPFGVRPRFAPVFNLGPFPWGGDSDTINQSSVRPFDPASRSDSIASLRVVIDVGAWGNSRFVLPSGQSGNPLSPHYADLHPLWRRGEGVPIAWTPEEVRAATRETLELVPAPPTP
jgi:penicillin amidase